MRTESAAYSKGSVFIVRNSIPKEGTKTRIIYDQFKSAPATPIYPNIDGTTIVYLWSILESLITFYGLDIRRFNKKRPAQYWLVGEWFGMTYVDYVAGKIKEAR